MSDHKSLFNTGAGQNSVGLDADHLHAALDVKFAAQFGTRIGELTSERIDNVDVLLGNQFRFTCFITQSNVKLFHLSVSFYG